MRNAGQGIGARCLRRKVSSAPPRSKTGPAELRRDTGLSGTERSEGEHTEPFPTLGAESSSHSHLGYYCGLRAPLAVQYVRSAAPNRIPTSPAKRQNSADARPLLESSSAIRSSGKGLKKVCPYKYSISKRMIQERRMLTALLNGILPRRYASKIR